MTGFDVRARSVLALAVVAISPGVEAPRLFAQAFARTAPVERVSPVPAFPAALPPAAPSVLAPAAPAVAPALAASAVFHAVAPASEAAPSPSQSLTTAHSGLAAAKSGEERRGVLSSLFGEGNARSETGVPREPAFGTLAFPRDSPLADVQVAEIEPNIFHLRFPTQYLMTSTFLRFQEHYESPKYRNKVFTLEEFMDWYAREKGNGQFTYFTDWGGFNIPSAVLRRFYQGEFDPLTVKEKDLLALFSGRKEPFYLIGTFEDKTFDALRHEIAHGLYATRPDYRREAQVILKDLDLRPVFKMLEPGYHRHSWLDEAHAYIGDGFDAPGLKGLYADAHEKLAALYRKYAGSGSAGKMIESRR